MNRWKYIKFFVISLLATYSFFQAFNFGDFRVFLDAATVLRDGKTPYDIWFIHHNCLYLYSPFFAVLLIPFTWVPPFIPNLLWISANWFFTFRSIQLFCRYMPKQFEISWQKKLLVIVPFVCMLRFWIYNIELLQMTIFMLWCMLECLSLSEQKKYFLAGFLLALGINIKILPIVLIPYLIIRGHWKILIPVAVFSIVFLLFPAMFFGLEFNWLLHKMWWAEINPSQGNQYAIESDMGPHSLNALIPSLLMQTNGDLPIARNFMNLSQDVVMNVVRIVQLFFIAFTLYFTGIKIKKNISGIQKTWELSYLFLVIPLIFPHQQKYAFFLLMPAILYITWFAIAVYNSSWSTFTKTKWRMVIALLVISFILMTLTTDGLIGFTANKITQHFKLITYGSLAVFGALTMCHPKFMENYHSSSLKTDDKNAE